MAEEETLEEYVARIVSVTRKKFLDCLDDDVIGRLGNSHLIFGKACAMEAVSTAMNEMADKIAETRDDPRTAAQIITDLERRLQVAREALEPFKEAADNLEDDEKDQADLWESPEAGMLTVGDLRRARQALTEIGASHE
jgi:hypothetical protein